MAKTTTKTKAPAKDGETKAARQPNAAFMKPLQPSKELGEVVGSDPLARSEVVSKIWEYIKKNNLQNPENKREILADDKLEPVFGKKKVTMFEMNKLLAAHLK
ncbi:SWIB/MDM2 domain-containing protein [Terrihabitans sp. B22-R8]|uniref:SWIB/MDM2 domain-containing protein n=1 Tax=Terrihabitans sp. B22-R8 TaxID=3425128 RepID=UPI00403D37B6